MSRPRRFAVYAREDKLGWHLSGYTLWFNEEWEGFLGFYEASGGSYRQDQQVAFAAARRDLADGKRPK